MRHLLSDHTPTSQSWFTSLSKYKLSLNPDTAHPLVQVGLSLLVGLVAGILLLYSWRLSPEWQGLILIIPVGLAFVLLVNDLEKLVLVAIAISVPLNLDVSLIISPYAQNDANLASGHRTLIALTELRLSLATIALAVGFALWLLRTRPEERCPARFFAGTTLPALGLIFFSLLSVFQAQDWQLASFRIAQLLETFLIYFFLANCLRTLQEMQFFIGVSLGGLFAESVLMVVQWCTNSGFSFAGVEAVILGPGRIGGTIGHPGPAAGYLASLGIIAGAMIWAFPHRSQRVFAAICFGLSAIALVGTGSRIGWAAFAATVVLFILAGLRNRQVKRETLILLIVIILAVGVAFYGMIYVRYTANDNGSAEARPMMYRLAWNMIIAHPLLGVGAGNQALETRQYYTPDVGDKAQVYDIQVHNRYLLIWAESGTFAFLCYIGFLGAAIVQAAVCAMSRDRWICLAGTGLSLAIISLCIQMITAAFVVRVIELFVWMLPAMTAGLYQIERSRSSRPTPETLGGSAYQPQFGEAG
jgi:O-antigen ligase